MYTNKTRDKRGLAHSLLVWIICMAAAASLHGCGGGSSGADPGSTSNNSGSNSGPGSGSTDTSTTVAPAVLPSLRACQPSGLGHDYQVGDGSGQIASLDQVPWESLAPGDTVRIFYRAAPYRGHLLLAAAGTATAPLRVCGVKGSNGERPIIDGQNAVARPGLSYTSASLNNIQQTRAIVMIDRLGTQGWTAFPSYVQIDGLEIRGATPSNTFTNSLGTVQAYDSFGACIWVQRGQHVTIADNVIHDCTNGVLSQSTSDGDFALTKDIRLAGNWIYGNGVVADEHEHNTYIQSVGVVYEFNHYGPLRSGALGNAIKDRSVGTVVRYNRLEQGAHAIDLVEAEAYNTIAVADPAYRTTYVYGNQIVKAGDTGTVIHYGGDHYGATPTDNWGEPYFRKGTLYFYANTVVVTGNSGTLFQLSTTDEHAEVWNNVFTFAPTVAYPSWRATSSVGTTWTAGGVLNFGVNWINANSADSDPYHSVPGTVSGQSQLIKGSSPPIDTSTLVPLAGSAVIDAAQANLSAVGGFPVEYQLDVNAVAQSRHTNGAAPDLGAVER